MIPIWSEEELQSCKKNYGCVVLSHNCDPSAGKDKSLPSDSYLIKYQLDSQFFYDITRAKKEVNIFDLYWDKFRSDLIEIKWTDGSVSPKLYGYKPPEETKKKR